MKKLKDPIQTTYNCVVLGLFSIFLVLKLTGIIAWSWWWIFSPFWVPFVIGFFLLLLWAHHAK